MILILLGAPGAGKGTQAEKITAEYNLWNLSTGDLLRSAVARGSELGRMAKKYMDAGDLLPDDVILDIIHEFLIDHHDEGVLFDGFPRTIAQAEGLEKLLEGGTARALAIVVPEEVAIRRLSSRRVCRDCGKIYNPEFGIKPSGRRCTDCNGELHQRDDDKPETIAARLKIYHKQTEPIIDFYRRRKQLIAVDGSGKPGEVFVLVKSSLN